VAELGPITCAGCGLLCDDVTVEHFGDGVRLRPPCGLGGEWFAERVRGSAGAPAATVRSQATDVEEAVARAAGLLRGARRPLLHGFDGATVEDARAAVELADRLGALIATEALPVAWPGAPAVPLRGASSSTLGEIRDRSRVVVIWREDPVRTHPRLLERLGFGADSHSRLDADRTLVVVDDRSTATAERAGVLLRWARAHDLAALTGLQVLARGRALGTSDLGGELHGLLERLGSVPHATFMYGPGLTAGAGGERRALALHELVRELSHRRHVVTLALPAAVGMRAAQDVLAWQTGYAGNVDLASGHPQLVTATSPLVDHQHVDVSLRIEGGAEELPAGVTGIALCSLPVAGIEVWVRTAAAGVTATGTAHRLDGVPLALQAPLRDDAPTAAAVLARLLGEIGR
jgi:formylmethanofuran dehydrogenase subunit B